MANEVNIKIKADDMASGKLKTLDQKAKDLRGTFTKVAAAGAAITGVFTVLTKSSLDQEIGINRLDQALKNVNSSYEEQKEAIEEAISATQAATNFGDEEQRDSLTKIISLVQDETIALEALSAATNLAAGMDMDLQNASLLVSKALTGNATALTRYGLEIPEAATNLEILELIQTQFRDLAIASADPTTQLGNRMGDLGQTIGDVLLPVMKTVVPALDNAIQKVIAFSEENPELTKTIVIAAGALGAAAVAVGTLGLALPLIISGITALKTAFVLLKVTMMTNPFGLIAVAIATLATLSIPLLIKHFDQIQDVAFKVVNNVVTYFENMANNVVTVINVMIEAFNFVNVFGDDIDTLGEVTFPRFKRSLDDTTDAIKDNSDAMAKNAEDAMFLAEAKIAGSESAKQAILEDMEELAKFEQQDRERRGAEIRAEQKAKRAAESGDFNLSYSDFLRIEMARVKNMPDVIGTGGHMSDALGNAFRNFFQGSQIAEHGQAGIDAQARFFEKIDTGRMFERRPMPSIHDFQTPVNVMVNGNIYGLDNFKVDVAEAVQEGLDNGGLVPYMDLSTGQF